MSGSDSNAVPKPWVDGPFELLSSDLTGDTRENRVTGTRHLASSMTAVHNLLLRGVNAVYLQCVNVGARGTPKDKLDFANFALQWGNLIHEHHESEEEIVFPGMNEMAGVPGLMDANVEEHALFHGGLEEYLAYLGAVTKEEVPYDGEKLKGIIDGFMPVLREHLRNEILTLNGLDKYEDKTDWLAWFKKLTDDMVSKQMKTAEFRNNQFALMFCLHDKSFENGVWDNFPPVPWVMGLVFRWLFFNTHYDWWRFAGCDFNSAPRELPFA